MEMQKSELNSELGVVRIADEVVSTVAGLAAIDVDGVSSMSGGWGTELVEKFGRKNFGKGIKVEVANQETKIDIFVIIDYGYEIPKVAEIVQKEVKVAVETMTGLTVSAVNIHVVGVAVKKEESAEIDLD